MFGRRYFGGRHFGPRYWGDGSSIIAHPTSGVLAGAGALIVGVATLTPLSVPHTTSGVLTGPGASLVGYAQRGIITTIGTRGRVQFSPKVSTATQRLTFDFTSQLVSGEFLLSATLALSVYRGADPLGLLAFTGATVVEDTRVSRFIQSGVVGCTYHLICRGVTNYNKKTFLSAFLTVV